MAHPVRRIAGRVRRFAAAVDRRVRYGRLRVTQTTHRGYRAAVAEAALVSFDVFDTALVRCVPDPADVFDVVAFRLHANGAFDAASAASFRSDRVEAERDARRRASAAGIQEVTLDEIYAAFAGRVPGLDAPRAASEELDVERAVCVANPDVLRLYADLQRAGRRIVFVSDTYFSADFVEELLAAAGYTGVHDVIVSSAERATKEHGSLLPLVARRLGVAPADIAHLGDNLGADVRTALLSGVRAHWYAARVPRHGSAADSLADKVIDRLAGIASLTPAATRDDDVLRNLGHETLGPIFLGLMQWMTDRLRADGTDLVLFCARDGYFLHQVYERFARAGELPPAAYFEVSRRALAFPAITKIDERALAVVCANNAALELNEYFARIGIDISQYPEELAAVGMRADTRVYDSETRRKTRDLFAALEDAVVARAASERTLLLEYIRQSGAFDATSIALVDIGWGGTLQQALADTLVAAGYKGALRAYYLSTDERILRLSAQAGPAEAWFANAAQPAWMQQAIMPGYWLLEIAFAAAHGTILGYRRRSDGGVEAIRHAYDSEAPNARASAAIHAASMTLIDRWIRIFGGTGPRLPMRETFARFERFVRRPTLDEARFFGDIVHIGGLGTTVEVQAIASPPRMREFIRRPKTFLDRYRESHWQIAYVQRIVRSNAAARAMLAARDVVRTARGLETP